MNVRYYKVSVSEESSIETKANEDNLPELYNHKIPWCENSCPTQAKAILKWTDLQKRKELSEMVERFHFCRITLSKKGYLK